MGVLWDRVAKFGLENVQVVRQAPLAFLVLVVMALIPTGAGMAFLFNWRYGTVIDQKNAVIDQKNATIAFQDEQLSSLRQAASIIKPAPALPLPSIVGLTPSVPINVFTATGLSNSEVKQPEPSQPEAETGRTPQYFLDILSKYNGLLAPKIMQPYVGTRMKFGGKSWSVKDLSNSVLVGITTTDGGYFQCEYNVQYRDYLSCLDKGDSIRGSGVLTDQYSGNTILLDRCQP